MTEAKRVQKAGRLGVGEGIKRGILFGLAGLEPLCPSAARPAYRPTFLVGTPRSGSTVTRLLFAEALQTSYFSNCLHAFQRLTGRPRPGIAGRLVRHFRRTGRSTAFDNTYGVGTGTWAPSEGEPIWERLFGGVRYDEVPPDALTPSQVQAMQRIVATTEKAFGGRPFLDKTTTLSVRIDALCRPFPDALFVHVSRDVLDMMQSVWVARTTGFSDWLGCRPRECRALDQAPIAEQVAKQVYYSEQHIQRAKSRFADRFLTVGYEDVCLRPMDVVQQVASFLRENEVPVQFDPRAQVPERFSFSHGRKATVPDAAYEDLLAAYSSLGGEA